MTALYDGVDRVILPVSNLEAACAPFERLVSQTYDGLAVNPLYPRAAGAAPVAGRALGQPWAIMQRADHPDPAAANVQALHDLQNGATGLTIVCAGSLNANGHVFLVKLSP